MCMAVLYVVVRVCENCGGMSESSGASFWVRWHVLVLWCEVRCCGVTQEREVNLSVVEKIFLLHGRSVLWVDSVCFGMTSLILWGESV